MASAKRNKQRARRLVQEAAVTATEVRTEATNLSEAVRSDGTIPVLLISPGWGSTGYYSPDVLEAAGIDRIFPRGTQMFLDHPGATERQDRPERSVRDLAAVLETDGTWQANGADGPGLYAQAKVFEGYQPLINELAPYIGVSIRAAAEVGSGEAEGRKGRIVERLVEGVSVDFVTKAGRGGKVLTILESHRPAATESGLYTDDLRDRLRAALVDRYGDGKDAWCYVRDFNDETVIFELYGDDVEDPGTFQLAYRISNDEVVLADGNPTEVKVTTTYTPVTTPSITTESQEDTMTPEQIQEAVAAAVKAEVTPIRTELDETKAKLATAETELAEAKTAGTAAAQALLIKEAREHVQANDKVKALPAIARETVVAALVHEATATDGKLDITKLDEATTKAVDAKVAELTEATGSPVRGVGAGDGAPATTEAVEAATTKATTAFQRLGLSEDAAKVAVAGRA